MSEHARNTVNEDPDLMTDEGLGCVAGGIGGKSHHLRLDPSVLGAGRGPDSGRKRIIVIDGEEG